MSRIWLLLLCVCAVLQAGEQSSPLTNTGYISSWLVAGPFPNGSGGSHGENCIGYYCDYLTAVGGETAVNPKEGDQVILNAATSLDWQIVNAASDGVIDLVEALQANDKTPYVAYAFAHIVSPASKKVVFRVNSDDGVRIWLNGHLIHDHHIGRGIEEDADVVAAVLQKGDNAMLVKVDQGTGGWAFSVAVLDENRVPVTLNSKVTANAALAGKIRSVRCELAPFVLKSRQGDQQLLIGSISSGGLKNLVCTIEKPEWQKPFKVKLPDMPAGVRPFEISIPMVKESGPARVSFKAATDQSVLTDVLFSRPRFSQIYLVQHTHTDIGYTRPQAEMLAEYFRYIDLALDFCDRTDSYPDDAKFRWTCESSWAVREYLQRRPKEQIERFRRRVAEGRIEVTAMLLNMSEISDENLLAFSLQPIAEFHKLGFPVTTAMQNDVNGAAWCLVDYLSGIGVRYLTMGINPDRSILPFKHPTAFWWESPSGQRLLAFRADHYMTGNAFIQNVPDLAKTRRALAAYLTDLAEKGYPFDRIAVQYNGYPTDNAPPAIGGAEIVRQWNETYQWPKLRLATAHEFPEYVEQKHSGDLKTFRVAWPDWWTDGVGSAARESGIVRSLHADMIANQGLFALAQIMGSPISPKDRDRIAAVQDALLFYDEHTYGAAQSISDPDGHETQVQWGQKASFAWEAAKAGGILREQALGLLQPYLPKGEGSAVAVFNTLNWPRSGLTEVFIDHEIIPQANEDVAFVDDAGKAAAAERIFSRSEGSRWLLWVDQIPAFGYKVYRIIPQARRGLAASVKEGVILENEFYRLAVDPSLAAVTSLIDKESGADLVAGSAPWQLGRLIYETLPARGSVDRKLFKQSSTHHISLPAVETNALWQSLRLTAEMEGCRPAEKDPARPAVTQEIRLYHAAKKIEFRYSIRKAPVTTPEAVYVAFPWNLQDGRIVYEAQGGAVTPGSTTLPGSASDWQTIQNYIAVRNGSGQIILGSDRAPLVMCGDLNLGKWQYQFKADRPYLYSYVMNNYWHTNFPASQQGEIAWNYYMTSTADTSNTRATRFGWENRVPLVARVIPPGLSHSAKTLLSALHIEGDNVLLVSATPGVRDGEIVLLVREVAGKAAELRITSGLDKIPSCTLAEVDVLQESAKPVTRIQLAPYASKFVRVTLALER